ncbi:transcription factor TFIIIB subunit BDP1 [Lachancea thermotolerans CBS 6340]|uniref:KLTH0G10274p n=1 Tax=Lachancea thermotolerans (strain ATCC 56472 / CBS 6340 / NRRL Y-8284) TaxID=559295 RepID=C5DMN2_LACTC|nr:KLTH0G10274p [Lachancea thermotolerans CBS 6340]CAR25043.1 KLTH0G10274p [Lachancea thermotolerans CBS 6340]
MSSVVNKSGTRFAPKIRQRRPVVSAPERAKTLGTSNDKANEAASAESEGNIEKPESEKPQRRDELDPLSQSTTKGLDEEIGSTQASPPASLPPGQRRRSSRLDSLSGANNMFKSGFMEPSQTAAPSGAETAKNRRLSTITGNQGKKKRMSSISESDTSFQAIKKRRMSSRSSISRKTGSAQRISILSHMNNMDEHLASADADDENLKNETNGDLFQRTDNLYEKYTISNAKEIPKNIADGDSSRYMVDEDSFTIADLCKPHLPIGETSDNFQRAQEAIKAKQETRKKRRILRARARENFKPLSELNKEEAERLLESRKKAAEEIMNADIPEADQKHAAIQLRMKSDGTFAVDEESTVVDRHKNATLEHAHKLRLDENPFENLFNSATYGRQQYTDPWTVDELLRFYKALSMWGTDFNLISQMFPYRTRRQIKAKFVNEEKKHPVMIELALRSKLPPNFDHYCTEIRKELITLEDFNTKLQGLQKEHEEHLKQIEVSKQSAKEEDLQSQKAKELDNVNKKASGGLRQDQLNAYRKTEVVLGTIDQMKRHRAQEPQEVTGP